MNLIYVKNRANIAELVMTLLVPVLTGVLTVMIIMNYLSLSFLHEIASAAAYGCVWAVLLLLMGLSSYRIKLLDPKGTKHGYFASQLLAAFLWHIVFFRFEAESVSFCIIVIYLFLIILTFFEFEKIDKKAGYLIFPGILWALAAVSYNFLLIRQQ